MLLKNKIVMIFIFFFMFQFNLNAKDIMSKRVIFKGKIIHLSDRFITVNKTCIALPKKIKAIDSQGKLISLESFKKGDYVIVTIEKNEAIIQRIGENQKDVDHELIPQ